MTKICIINPPRLLMKGDAICVYFPVGIAHLATYLKEKGMEVMIIDMIAERRNILIQLEFQQFSNLLYFSIIDSSNFMSRGQKKIISK